MELITSMKKKKTRLIVRKGNENIALKVEDIAFIYRDNTIIVAVDKEEKKYLCDRNLSALEEELDETMFFSVPIVSIWSISTIYAALRPLKKSSSK